MNESAEQPGPGTGKMNLLATLLAIVALLAGIGVGLLALGASLGVWVGAWDFRRGFELLRMANENAGLTALLCLGITVIVAVLGWRLHLANKSRLLTMAVIGTIAAALAYLVPQSYAPDGNIPPIHDIATDTANPPQFVDVLPLRGPDTNSTVYGTGIPGMTPEEQARLQAEAYPDIQPVVIAAPADEVFQRALDAVEELGWDLVAQVPEEGRIEATDTTFWFRFKDDIVIMISEGPQGTVVNARSTSRVGRSDVGKNAARLREFFATL